MIYDYRSKSKDFGDIATQLDNFSEAQLLKVVEAVEEISQSNNEINRTNTKIYFNNAILPILQDFAELTSSLLTVEEKKQNQIIEATLKNTYGFDITESCKCMKILFVLANHIGISSEEEETILSFIFDSQELH